jgi:hypothetical protein
MSSNIPDHMRNVARATAAQRRETVRVEHTHVHSLVTTLFVRGRECVCVLCACVCVCVCVCVIVCVFVQPAITCGRTHIPRPDAAAVLNGTTTPVPPQSRPGLHCGERIGEASNPGPARLHPRINHARAAVARQARINYARAAAAPKPTRTSLW